MINVQSIINELREYLFVNIITSGTRPALNYMIAERFRRTVRKSYCSWNKIATIYAHKADIVQSECLRSTLGFKSTATDYLNKL